MEDTINPMEAKRLREAFKQVKESEEEDCLVRGDHVEVRSFPGGKHERLLVIFKDGKAIASVPIINSTFKRLKREWIYWNDIQSGMLSSHRGLHGLKGKAARGWN